MGFALVLHQPAPPTVCPNNGNAKTKKKAICANDLILFALKTSTAQRNTVNLCAGNRAHKVLLRRYKPLLGLHPTCRRRLMAFILLQWVNH